MPLKTYYAVLEQVDRGYRSTVVGLDDVTGSGRTALECGVNTRSTLTEYINQLKKEGKPIPEPVYKNGALGLEIKIMNTALIFQRDRSIGILLQ